MSPTKIYENLPPKIKKVVKKTLLPIFKWLVIKPLEFWHILNIEEKNQRSPILFIDISILHKSNSGTGIQRVVQQVLKNLQMLNLTHEIRPCFFKWMWSNGLYDCATQKSVCIQKGDIFLGLDLSTMQIYRNQNWLKKMREKGCPLFFIMYDIFPLTHPEYVDEGTVLSFQDWFWTILPIMDGVISISKTTENDLKNYLKKLHPNQYNQQTKFSFIHLGADFKNKQTTQPDHPQNKIPQFLAVSTVEPRKRYDLILNAFHILWAKNLNIHLHIVGKAGWKNENLIQQLNQHPQLNCQLFWHNTHISDEDLQRLYINCDACIFASDAEGFGLAVVEAAFYHKPLILRDIPIFHEVAQEQAFFFSGETAESFAADLERWLQLNSIGKITPPTLRIYTWRETAIEVARILNITHSPS